MANDGSSYTRPLKFQMPTSRAWPMETMLPQTPCASESPRGCSCRLSKAPICKLSSHPRMPLACISTIVMAVTVIKPHSFQRARARLSRYAGCPVVEFQLPGNRHRACRVFCFILAMKPPGGHAVSLPTPHTVPNDILVGVLWIMRVYVGRDMVRGLLWRKLCENFPHFARVFLERAHEALKHAHSTGG